MTKTDEEQQFADAVAIANIPTLLMVLVQLTGERQWMDVPYRPERGRGMGDNDTGGLPEAVQQEIREAALEAILAWRAGRPVAIPEPSYDLLVEMLGCAMGEPVPPEYGPMIAAQLGLQPFTEDRPLDVPEGFSVLDRRRRRVRPVRGVQPAPGGHPLHDRSRRAPTVGGTWWDNRYPGAGVDTPNHLYSFSFATYDWSMYFALRDELHDYLESVADRFDLRRDVRFETEVVSMAYEADDQRWAVTVRRARRLDRDAPRQRRDQRHRHLQPAEVPRHRRPRPLRGSVLPHRPVAGRSRPDRASGWPSSATAPAPCRSAPRSRTRWRRSPSSSAHRTGRRRSSSSAGRCPSRCASSSARCRCTERGTACGWAGPSTTGSIPPLQKDPNWEHPERSLNAINDGHREYFTQYIHAELGDRTDLLDTVVPTYPPFGKRMLMDNGWYRMLRNEKVELVTDPIAEIGRRPGHHRRTATSTRSTSS